jgi:hypothetical protein
MTSETTFGEFMSYTKDYLKQLVTKPSAARIDDSFAKRLREKDISQKDFLKLLLIKGIIKKKSKVTPPANKGEEVTYSVKYKIPADNFTENVEELYNSLFGNDSMIDEATSCAAGGAGPIVVPLGMPIKKKIHMTEEQFNFLMDSINEAANHESVDI